MHIILYRSEHPTSNNWTQVVLRWLWNVYEYRNIHDIMWQNWKEAVIRSIKGILCLWPNHKLEPQEKGVGVFELQLVQSNQHWICTPVYRPFYSRTNFAFNEMVLRNLREMILIPSSSKTQVVFAFTYNLARLFWTVWYKSAFLRDIAFVYGASCDSHLWIRSSCVVIGVRNYLLTLVSVAKAKCKNESQVGYS